MSQRSTSTRAEHRPRTRIRTNHMELSNPFTDREVPMWSPAAVMASIPLPTLYTVDAAIAGANSIAEKLSCSCTPRERETTGDAPPGDSAHPTPIIAGSSDETTNEMIRETLRVLLTDPMVSSDAIENYFYSKNFRESFIKENRPSLLQFFFDSLVICMDSTEIRSNPYSFADW